MQEIESLDDIEKLRLVGAILADLDKPDQEIDRIWAEEARKRWLPTRPDAFAPFRTKIKREYRDRKIRFLDIVPREVEDTVVWYTEREE